MAPFDCRPWHVTRLLLATTNPDKIIEIRRSLEGLPVTLETLADHPPIPEPHETGRSFADNARLKALHYHQATGRITVAEDSGLEIDALDGAPGVLSSRFNGDTYPEKFRAMYDALQARGQSTSAARFVCALALARDGAIVYEATGRVEGTIAPAPRGAGGFGYDPIFFYPPSGRTLAEVPTEEKAAVSHRGQAFRALRVYLEKELHHEDA